MYRISNLSLSDILYFNEDMTTPYKWTTFEGAVETSDTYPGPLDTILELILTKPASVRACDSLGDHETIMMQLPPRLEVLRMNDCRIRTWPTLPTTIREVYADGNDFFHVPTDMSEFRNLLVLQVANGRLDDFRTVLPPVLAHCDLSTNALGLIELFGDWPAVLPEIVALSNPARLRVLPEVHAHRVRVREAPVPRPVRQRTQGVDVLEPTKPTSFTVYKNTQNVHDSGIQASTKRNLAYLTSLAKRRDRGALFDILKQFQETHNSLHRALRKEIGKRLAQPYSMHGYHLQTVLDGVIARIQTLEGDFRATGIQRLQEEVLEAQAQCLNGFMVRLCNVLVGLDDAIEVQLNASQILQARVPQTMKRVREAGGWQEGSEPWQWALDCFKETVKDLDECDVTKTSERQTWLSSFLDEFSEELKQGCKEVKDVEARWTSWDLPDEAWALQQCIQEHFTV